MLIVTAIALGLSSSPFYGLGEWLVWQALKHVNGTMIPTGEISGAYGAVLGWGAFKLPITGVLLGCGFMWIGWWALLSYALMWIASGWIATSIERRLYANESELKALLACVDLLRRDVGSERAMQMTGGLVPGWWLDLMPKAFRDAFLDGTREILSRQGDDTGLPVQ